MIELRGIRKVYGKEVALESLDLEIEQGEICVLLGSSGCGKSTTLKCINGLVQPDEGEVLVRGQYVKNVSPVALRRSIGYAFQHVGLFPHYTVSQNCSVVPELLGWEKKRIQARVRELLAMFSLNPDVYQEKYPHQLSGGEAQRVGVARALASDPDILLLDEPFGAVDPPTRKKLQREFLEIQSELKKTIVFVTHDIEEALTLGSRIVVMHDGKIAQSATPLDLLRSPASAFVREFLGQGLAIQKLSLLVVDDYCDSEVMESDASQSEISSGTTLYTALNHMVEHKTQSLAVSGADGKKRLLTLTRILEA